MRENVGRAGSDTNRSLIGSKNLFVGLIAQ